MKERILRVMQENKMSASKFADTIGVPRSGLSHVLKGRNKPSIDYVLKILDAFPQIDSGWLLLGKGNYSNIKKDAENFTQTNDIHSSITNVNKKMASLSSDLLKEVLPNEIIEPKNKQLKQSVNMNFDNEQLEKIVFFYYDGSFKEYHSKQ